MVNSREKILCILGAHLIQNIVYHVLFTTIHSQYRSTDYFPPVLAGVDVIDLRMNHCSIMRHHSRRHRPSYPKTAVLPLGRTGRTTASRPVPSGALGSPPARPRRAPGRLGMFKCVNSERDLFYVDNTRQVRGVLSRHAERGGRIVVVILVEQIGRSSGSYYS